MFYSNFSEQHAYDSGKNGSYFFPSTEQERSAYQAGQFASGNHVGKLMGIGVVLGYIILRPVIYYSPFLLAAYYTIALLTGMSIDLIEVSSIEQVVIGAIFLMLPAYFYFCLFYFLRGIMICAKEKNIPAWRIGFLIGTLIITVVPSIVTFKIFEMLTPGFGAIMWLFAFIAIFKGYLKFDLLNKDNTPILAKWAFDLGLDWGNSKLTYRKVKSRMELTLEEKKIRLKVYMVTCLLIKMAGLWILIGLFETEYHSDLKKTTYFLMAVAWLLLSTSLVRYFAAILYEYYSRHYLVKNGPAIINLIIWVSGLLLFLGILIAHFYLGIEPNPGMLRLSAMLGLTLAFIIGLWYGLGRVKVAHIRASV